MTKFMSIKTPCPDHKRRRGRPPSSRYGRIIRLKSGSIQPPALAGELDRRVVMVMGPSGLKSLSGKTTEAMLESIGYTRDYVQHKIAEGYLFYLISFKRPRGKLYMANWKNTLAAVAEAYPEIEHLIDHHGRELARTSFTAFEERAGFSFARVDKIGITDKRYMTLARLLTSPGSVTDLRRFLYHTIRLSELYCGNGRTRSEDGLSGLREYIMANRPLSELEDCTLVPLDIKVSDKP